MLHKFINFTGLVLLRLVVSFSWVNMVPSNILVMLLDSDPDNGILESLVRPASLMILLLTLYFCLHSRFDKVIHVISMVS